jgi:hypothetical protein
MRAFRHQAELLPEVLPRPSSEQDPCPNVILATKTNESVRIFV